MSVKIENTDGYAFFEGKPSKIHKRRRVTVEFILDAVPGAWHQPEDMMNWIATNSYVASVTLEEEEGTEMSEEWDREEYLEYLENAGNGTAIPREYIVWNKAEVFGDAKVYGTPKLGYPWEN